ncbi:endonuclease/exonuclease/phosphatase family protein [Plantactinospora sonchi]|uniref:Endonuclease/exonuclease/phosphatase family protein n=1 Tax=Plantactinospora sonchi TaxID=1544735 RepID=A0ABU7S3D8_9ACTN
MSRWLVRRPDRRTGPGTRPGRRFRPRRGHLLASVAVLLATLLVGHSRVPNTPGRLGSLLETFLPWLGLGVPVLLGIALLRRSVVALLALLLPGAAWLGLFGPDLVPADDPPHDVTAVQHNVSDENPDPAGTARALLDIRPDLVALQELTPAALPTYAATLAPELPHQAVYGTVGLWSRFPLTEVHPVDIRPEGFGPDWNRGLRATARTHRGDVAVYVTHLPSLRLGLRHGFRSGSRDESATLLGNMIVAEPLHRMLLLGDLNGTVDDRGLAPVTSRMTSTGPRFPFSWPAALPVARIDHVLARTATITHLWSLPATGSDHLPVAARVRLGKDATAQPPWPSDGAHRGTR